MEKIHPYNGIAFTSNYANYFLDTLHIFCIIVYMLYKTALKNMLAIHIVFHLTLHINIAYTNIPAFQYMLMCNCSYKVIKVTYLNITLHSFMSTII